jgi:DNA ligase-1
VQAELDRLDVRSAELLGRILRRDLRAGFSSSTVNKAIKGLIKEYPYQRCSLPAKSNLKEFDWARGAYSQLKADGTFVNVSVDEKSDVKVALRTRQGNDLPLAELTNLVEAIDFLLEPGYGYQGELVVFEDGKLMPRKAGNGVLNSVLRGGKLEPNQKVVFEVWDRIPLDKLQPDGEHREPYEERYQHLVRMLEDTGGAAQVRLIETRIVHSFEEAVAHCREVVSQGLEGTIVKSAGAFWRDGTSKDQVKLKIEAVCDLRIRGILPGDEGKKNAGRAGRLRLSTEDDRLVVDVTVKNEAMRDALDARPQDFLGGIVEVLFNDIMEPGASNPLHCLYLPRLKNDFVRADKDIADSLERVYEQFEEAKKLEGVLQAQG